MAAKVGNKAPAFRAESSRGGELAKKDLDGEITVLFFYPKDNTSGCTKEAIGFTEAIRKFRARGARVFGVSRDSLKSHANFTEKHGLKVPLLSDPEKTMHEAFGVMKEKTMYGKKVMGVDRSTFLIGPDGRIAREWRGVKVPGHVDEVLEAVSELKKSLK